MLASVRILIDADVVAARRTARALSESLAFSAAQRLAWAGAVGAVAQHALHNAGGGEAVFEDIGREGVRGLQATIREQVPTPGERNPLRDRSTLIDLQRAVDALSIDQDSDGRNVVRLLKWEDLAQRKLRERARDLI